MKKLLIPVPYLNRLVISALLALFGGLLAPLVAEAQTFPTADYFRRMRYHSPASLPAPEGLRDRVVDGKLRLSLRDTIELVLANNTDVQINRLAYEQTRYSLLRSYSAFDPLFTASFDTRRSTTPTSSQLEGAAVSSSLSQQTNLSWSQTFQTGTRFSINFSGSKSATNSIFSTFNPSINSALSFNLSQPLLRNRWLFANRAPIVIAQRGRNQSRANFEVQVTSALASAIEQYWGVVQARENLKVLRKSLEQAEATYKQNKRALELGALPPLDIYRSESQVASRRVAVIQAEYQLRQLEDDFRRTIGADLDPYFRALDLELIESPETPEELAVVDPQEALERALQRRPELVALREQLAADDTSVRLAHNNLQPDLGLTAFYSSSGRGGNAIDTSTSPPTIISRGGFVESFEQLGSFDFPSYGFSLQLRLPIRNRGAQADLGNALVGQRRTQFQFRRAEQGVTLDVRNAINQLEQAKLSMAAARIARDLAQKNLEAEQRKYELGVQTIFFVLDAQTQLAQAEQDLLRSQISYQRALTALDRATGQLLERNQVRIE
jgi:HAE1 family hydrophobic/amphiphilic exporter-1